MSTLDNFIAHQELQDENFDTLDKDYRKIIETPTGNLNQNKLRVVELAELLAMNLPQREYILSPWLPSSGLSLIHAKPGIGKTHIALGVAFAVAAGSEFLGWKAPKPRGVLYIDGEIPGSALQERLANIVIMNRQNQLSAKLQFITPDLQGLISMPDLGTLEGQQQVNEFITDDIELVIVDNLSCLVRTGKENDSEAWQPIQSWALNLRSKGKSVLFIHHQSKNGVQRGSSKKEDVLDSILSLKRPDDYTQDQGARFIITFEKSRGFYGDDAKPFEASLTPNEHKRPCWITRSLEESTFDKVVSLLNDGCMPKEIVQELKINKATVSKYSKRARENGLLNITKGEL